MDGMPQPAAGQIRRTLKPPKNTLQWKNHNRSAVLISQDVDVPGQSFNLMEP